MLNRLLPLLRTNPLLSGVVAFAVVLVVAIAGYTASERAQEQLVSVLNHDADVYALGLRGAAERYDYLPYAVSQQPDVIALLTQHRAIAQVNHYLEELNRRAGSSALYVLDVQGNTLAASNWSATQSFVGNNYRDRPYFKDALAGRRGLFHGVGLTTHVPGMFISTPIWHGALVVGVAVVKVGLDKVAQIWASARDPVLLTDKRGIVFLSSEPAWLYHTARPLGAEDLAFVRGTGQYPNLTSNADSIPDAQAFPPLTWQVAVDASPGARAGDRVAAVATMQAKVGRDQRSYLMREIPIPELDWTLTVMASYQPVVKARNQVLLVAIMLALLLGVTVLFSWNRELRREREFRTALEGALRVGMRARDMDGRIIYVNAALCDMLGFAAYELLGKAPPYPYWLPDEHERHWRDNDAAMSGRAAKDGFESRIRHKDGHDVYTKVYTVPLRGADGKQLGWMSSVIDISGQKRAQAQLQEHIERLHRASRIAHIGEIASSIAHELNQPLQALAGYATVATDMAEAAPDSALAPIHHKIQAQVQRCGDIVKRIRALFLQQPTGFKPCDLPQLVASVLALLQPQLIKERIRVAVSAVPDIPMVLADALQIEQVLINLTANAVQAMQSAPDESIADAQPAEERRIDIAIEAVPNGVQLRFHDNGPGMDPDVARQLFTAYFTTKADGLGLGLNICKTIIERHGGSMGFDSQPGQGATFYFTIPCVR